GRLLILAPLQLSFLDVLILALLFRRGPRKTFALRVFLRLRLIEHDHALRLLDHSAIALGLLACFLRGLLHNHSSTPAARASFRASLSRPSARCFSFLAWPCLVFTDRCNCLIVAVASSISDSSRSRSSSASTAWSRSLRARSNACLSAGVKTLLRRSLI